MSCIECRIIGILKGNNSMFIDNYKHQPKRR